MAVVAISTNSSLFIYQDQKDFHLISVTKLVNINFGKCTTGNDRYSGKNGRGFLFHYSGCFHYSGRLLYGTQHILQKQSLQTLQQLKNGLQKGMLLVILTSFTSMVGWGNRSDLKQIASFNKGYDNAMA